jgi:D-alanine-D-alanine ligase
MNIVVLAGGLSPERDISLSSGSLIANALISKGHKVLLLDVYEGINISTSDYCDLFIDINANKTYNHIISDVEPDLEEIKRRNNNGNSLIGKNVLNICEYADVVFIALHGAMGENGQLQATFDTLGIRYTGTGYIGSLLAMDKDITKKLLVQSNIPTAEWVLFNTKNDKIDIILNSVGFPCVVKPCSCGSSVGVSIVHNIDELKTALSFAKKYEKNILVEKMIKGREFSVGVLDNKILPPIEIIPLTGFYDYKNKYQAGLTKEICPAELTVNETNKISEFTLKIHEILRLGDYSRIDFILNENGDFFCLEANTLPGMTPTSLIPQEAAAIGIKYEEFCEQIAFFAIKNK